MTNAREPSLRVGRAKYAACIIGLSGLTAVWAQEQTGRSTGGFGALEEITVTATRKEESLSKVPVSLSVLTQDVMEEKHIQDIGDVARFTPGLTVDPTGTSAIAIRGISSSGGAGTTGIYIDDVPIQVRNLAGTSANALVKIFDLDRIEVLRGPQGTLFGSGSEGGTVRYITTQPSLTQTSGHAKAETSFTTGGSPSYEAGLAAGAPLVTGTLGVRASAWFRRDGGWIDRIDPLTLSPVESNANRNNTVALRVAALWQATDALRVTPAVFYQNRQQHAQTIYWPLYSDPDNDRYVNANATSHPNSDRFYLPSLNIEAELGSAKLTSTTSYFRRDALSGGDGTEFVLSLFQQYAYPLAPLLGWQFPLIDQNGMHIPAGLENDYQDTQIVLNHQRNFTQEVRLQSTDPAARLTWTLGLFYSNDSQESYARDYEPGVDPLFQRLFGANFGVVFGTPLNPDGSTYLAGGTDSYTNLLRTVDKQIAGFGEASYKLTDALKLTVGLRVAKSKVSLLNVSGGAQPDYGFTGSSEQNETPTTPKVGLSWQMNPNNLFYATYAKGFRPGGGNPPIPYVSCAFDFQNFGIPGAPLSYNSDTVQSFEVGAKNNIENRIRLASSVYYIKWKNIQQSVNPAVCSISWTQNLGEAASKGFDLQADVLLTEALQLELAVGYTDARYTDDAFVGTGRVNTKPVSAEGDAIVDANGLPIVPWTVSAGAQYKFNVFELPSFVRLDYQYSSGQKWGPATLDPRTLQYGVGASSFYQPLQSWKFLTLRAGTSFNNWTASLFVDNLLDTNTTLTSSRSNPTYDFSTGTLLATPLYRNFTFRPRTVGIAATYRF
jgi:iron complex outermembrane recepter protein